MIEGDDFVEYLAQFRQGYGAMAQNAIDFYLNKEGKIIQCNWAMGGQSMKEVESVPASIQGYRVIL